MAASYKFGISVGDVLAEVPVADTKGIDSISTPVKTGDIAKWINDASGKMNNILDKAGIEGSASMDPDAHDAVGAAVKAYGVYMVLKVLGVTGPMLDEARNTWNTLLAQYSNRPQDLGGAYTDGFTTTIDADVKAEDYDFIDSEGSIW